MKRTLLLTAALSAVALCANAVAFEDVWSGNWTPAYQTAYGAGNGTLISNPGSNGDTVLHIIDGNPISFGPAALLGDSLYSHFSFPAFTFVNIQNWEGVTRIVLEITYGGNSNETAPILMVYNGLIGDNPVLDFVDNSASGGAEATDVYSNTYIWNFAEAVDLTSLEIGFTTVGGNTAYSSFKLTVVPEPSTYAMILGAVVLGGVAIARRRRA